MDQKIAEKWVAALRSGEYKQGQDRLKDGDRYCCLGVLCDLHAREHADYPYSHAADGVDTFYGNRVILPGVALEWAGMSSPYGTVNGTTLVNINDRGATFDEIAGVIERQYTDL